MNIRQAADQAMNLGKQLQAVIDVGNTLNELGDLAQAHSEALARTQTAVTEQEKAESELVKVQASIEVGKLDLSRARSEVKKVLANATQQEANILALAREEKEKIRKLNEESCKVLVENTNQEVHSLENYKSNLTKEVVEMKSALTTLKDQMKALRERLG